MTRWGFVFAIGLSALAGCNPVHAIKGKGAAEQAVKEFHDQLDKAAFRQIYQGTHPDFKAATPEKDFLPVLEAIHRKLGVVKSAEPSGWNLNSNSFQTNIVVAYETKFAEGDATETFTYRIEGEKAVLLGYNINSMTLIIK